MKKHVLKETNSMRRLMGLDLLNEEKINEMKLNPDLGWDAGGVDGVYVNQHELDKYEKGEDSSMSDPTMDEHDGSMTGDQGKEIDYPNDQHTDKGYHGEDGESGGDDKKDGDIDYEKKKISEDSEGEETYNYGEDEGADEHREDEMEDELHHDEEDMAPHDRIKAIEDHLDALKKDMGYDEDHEDRDEEGTHFAEGKRYNKVLNTLTESQYRKLKRFINEGPTATPNIEVEDAFITVTDGNGKKLYEGIAWQQPNTPIKARFDANEIMTVMIPGLVCESAMFNSSLDGKPKMPAKCNGDKIMFNVSHFGTEKLNNDELLTIKGNVHGGTTTLKLNMYGSSVKQA